jgi:hypothetical protein
LREGRSAEDDEEDHGRNPDGAPQRFEQRIETQRAIGGGKRHGGKRAERGGLRRRRNAARHCPDDHHEDRDERQHIAHQQLVSGPTRSFLEGGRRRQRRIRARAHDDVADERDAEHQARNDAADQQLRNRNPG